MNKIDKSRHYNTLSKLLDGYEAAKEGGDLERNWEMELYLMLVTIRCHWEELTEGE